MFLVVLNNLLDAKDVLKEGTKDTLPRSRATLKYNQKKDKQFSRVGNDQVNPSYKRGAKHISSVQPHFGGL